MKINIKDYVIRGDYVDDTTKNAFECVDLESNYVILVRSSSNSKVYNTFENNFFLMKTNVVLQDSGNDVGIFHIVVCKKKEDTDLIHFKRVSKQLFILNNRSLDSDEMLNLFNSLERIFSEVQIRDRKSEIGLYGELSFLKYIYENYNKSIYKYWHANALSKFDMEINQKAKIEIKTTSGTNRIHKFRHDQLKRDNMDIYISSIIIKSLEKGFSLYQLCLYTLNKLINSEQKITIETFIRKLGLSENYQGIMADLDEVYSSMKFYSVQDIPTLEVKVPEGINNLSYDIDLNFSIETELHNIFKE